MNVSCFMKTVMRSVWLLGVVGTFWACDHAMPVMQQAPPANLQATLSSIQDNIFTPKCSNRACHPGTSGGPMSLRTGESYAALVGVVSPVYGRPRVAPGNANNSVLYLKVIGDNSVGNRMPALGQPLTQAETDTIKAWINRGALRDGGVVTGPINSVRIIRPNNTTISVGGTLALTAQAFDANNNMVPTTFTWSSSAPNVATVNATTGAVTGVSAGMATITAGAAGKSDTLGVTIVSAPSTLQATLSSIQANIFTPKCVNAGCHPGGGAPMSLRAGESFGTLVGVNSAYGRPRVAPGNANNSTLYLKVIGNNTVGGRMPPIGLPLSQAETDSIAAWINRGALNN